MKMRISGIIALGAALLGGLCSCSDLELGESQYHTKKYQFSDFDKVKEVMTNVYGYLESDFCSFRECATDDAVYANSPDTLSKYYDGSWSANNVVDDKWAHYYSGIRAANYLLENCPEDFEIAKWNEQYTYYIEQLKNYPWEARALRAYFHFELLKRYQNIILADRTYTVAEVNGLVPATYEESVQWIASELEECAENLPATYSGTYYSELGRVTKGFAQAARARVLLYAASPLNNSAASARKYAEAAQAAQEIIADCTTSASPRYILMSQKYNAESKDLIFGVRESTSSAYEANNFPVGYEGGNSGTCPTLNLVECFESGDPRLADAVLCNGDSFKGEAVESFYGGKNGQPKDNASPTSFYLKKYIQEATSFTTGNLISYQHIYPIFRYAEVWLNYAEALFEATKNPDFTGSLEGVSYTLSPRAALNTLRAVYSLPDIPSGLSESEFRGRLRNERRVELCFEGHRYWDIRRWKIGEVTKTPEGLDIVRTGDDSYTATRKTVATRYWDDKMYWYPISETERHKNGNLIQNVGW